MSTHKHPVKIKYKVATFTDFGEPGRRELIGQHKTIATAMRQYARIWEIYGRRKIANTEDVLSARPYIRKTQPKVWQEMIEEDTSYGS